MADEESFKVTDRRGRPRESTPAASAPSVELPTSAASERGAPGRASSAAEAATGGPDLQSLFVMFASSALINLGEAPDPATGERHVDLGQAQQAIDLLLLLRDKTQGNRTEQESRLLEQVLYDLELRFVHATGGSAGP
jgi:hypothetical protein